MWTHVYVPIVQDLYNWFTVWHSQHEKCPHSVFFWSVFSRIPTEYGEIRSISPYSVRMRENTGKMWTRVTPNTDSVWYIKLIFKHLHAISTESKILTGTNKHTMRCPWLSFRINRETQPVVSLMRSTEKKIDCPLLIQKYNVYIQDKKHQATMYLDVHHEWRNFKQVVICTWNRQI